MDDESEGVVIGSPDRRIVLRPLERSADDVETEVFFDVDGFTGQTRTGLVGGLLFADQIAAILETMSGSAELRSVWGSPFSLSLEAYPPGRVEVRATVGSDAALCATTLSFVVEQSYLIETVASMRQGFRAPAEASPS